MALSIVAFGWRLGDGPLTKTEPHRAIPAHQMVESGSWLVPRLWGEQYLAKPPLHYWILAAAEMATGVASELVWRLPSMLAAAATALVVAVAAGRWFGRPAGLVAGCSFLGLLALWSQNVKADIDATHTLAVTAAALGVLELGRPDAPRRASIVIATGLALGAALLLKGPAGLPVVVGAVVGPALANRSRGPLLRPGVYAVLGLGVGLFLLWAAAAYRQVGRVEGGGDTQGIQEVVRNVLAIDGTRVLKTVSLPAVMFAYALPLSLLVPWSLGRNAAVESGPPRWMVRGLGGTIVVAVVSGAVAGMVNPRYLYIVLPLLCPLAGAFGQACVRGATPWPQPALIVTSVALAVAHLVLAGAAWRQSEPTTLAVGVAAVIVAGVAVAACGGTVLRMHRRRWTAGLVGLVVSLLLLRVPFVDAAVARRIEASPRAAAGLLRATVGVGTPVTADAWVMTAPQLFFYAGVDVEYGRDVFWHPHDFDEDRWIVFSEQEWKVWRKAMGRRFDSITPLPFGGRTPVLVRYRAPEAGAGGP